MIRVLFGVALLLGTTMTARADIRWYFTGGEYGYTYGDDTADEFNGTAVCAGYSLDSCQSMSCDACHGSAAPEMRKRRARHVLQTFQTRAIQLSPGSRIPFGKGTLRLASGRVSLVDAQGREVSRFPSDAVLLRPQSGSPHVIFYPGREVPRTAK